MLSSLATLRRSLGFWPSSTSNFFRSGCTSSVSTPPNNPSNEDDALYKMVEIELRGNDTGVLKSFLQFSQMAAGHLDINLVKHWMQKKAHHERYTLLRSIHVNKKCRTQYEFRTYYAFLQFEKLTGSTCDTLLEYLQRNLPEGTAMKVTKVALEKMPAYIKQ